MKILDLAKKYKFITIVIIILMFIIIPIGLNYLCWIYGWNAETVVGYYGTLLGATSTIIAVIITIRFTEKTTKADRRHQEYINHKNLGIEYCVKFAIACDVMGLQEIIEEIIPLTCNDNENIESIIERKKVEISRFSDKIRLEHIKFQFTFPELCDEMSEIINDFVGLLLLHLKKINKKLYINDKILNIPEKEIIDLFEWYNCTYPDFVGTLRNIAFKYNNNQYECSYKNNCKFK